MGSRSSRYPYPRVKPITFLGHTLFYVHLPQRPAYLRWDNFLGQLAFVPKNVSLIKCKLESAITGKEYRRCACLPPNRALKPFGTPLWGNIQGGGGTNLFKD
jgi:hypothetical protein